MDRTQRYPFSDLDPEQLRNLMAVARKEQADVVLRAFRALFRNRTKRQPTPIECREPHPLLLVSNG